MRNLFLKLLIVLFLPSISYAATEFTVTVNKTGEDYGLLSTAEDALDLAGDLTDGTVKCGSYDGCSGTCDSSAITDGEAVTWDGGSSSGTVIHITSTQYSIDVTTGSLADDDTVDDGESNTFNIDGAPDSCIYVMELYDDDGDLDDKLSINGLTTDSTNYVKATVPSGERHGGDSSSGAAISSSSTVGNGAGNIECFDNNGIVEWFIVKDYFASFSGSPYGIYAGQSNDCIIRNNIVFSDSPDLNSEGIFFTRNNNVLNNIVYNQGEYCIEQSDNFGDSSVIVNNTCYNYNTDASGETGIKNSCGSGNVDGATQNNLSIEGTNSADSYTCDADCIESHNGGSGTSACGTNEQDSLTTSEFVSTTATSEDLHLDSGATSIDAGFYLGTTNGVNIDIDGDDRTTGDTTTEFNSITSDGDGQVQGIDFSSWDTSHDKTTGNTVNDSGTTMFVGSDNSLNTITRGFVPFDTSSISDTDAVLSATFKIYVTATSNGDNDGDDWINVVQTDQASSTNLTTADYNNAGATNDPTEGSTRLDITSITTSAYNNFILNSTALGWVDVTGVSFLGLREGHDAIDSVPTGGNTVTFNTSENSSNKPVLSVIHGDAWDLGADEFVAAGGAERRIWTAKSDMQCFDDDRIKNEYKKCKIGNRWSMAMYDYYKLGYEDI